MFVDSIFLGGEITSLENNVKTKINTSRAKIKTDRAATTNIYSPERVRKGIYIEFEKYNSMDYHPLKGFLSF
ncbi:hypothetical protein SAMN04488009_2921 [Maribacter sedimenticola]|uniref:Uncharacterized protein n=1 Tax=Maribacter sedimenticola TaxID=228956 RepID=A0ABY1SK13_9FLAO|nr:hypothetical protein SAMN04488009_2921 [Maribacter sedimenticola]